MVNVPQNLSSDQYKSAAQQWLGTTECLFFIVKQRFSKPPRIENLEQCRNSQVVYVQDSMWTLLPCIGSEGVENMRVGLMTM